MNFQLDTDLEKNLTLSGPITGHKVRVAIEDRLVLGIALSNSEIGLRSFGVEAFFWRLAYIRCSSTNTVRGKVSST